MRITYEHRFDASVDEVMAMLSDEEFNAQRARASGADDCDVLVDRLDDGSFTVAIRRTVPATDIPQEFRSLVGGKLTVRYTEAWAPAERNGDPTDREGTFALEIPGTPGHARGAVVVKPMEGGAAFGLAGDVQAPVPLIGAVVERAVASAIEQALPKELAAADAWLAARANGA
jgi:hypothetical protein